ncbi:MAG: DUF1801 domain-containing protein [Acidobacteria bacterium]|nr:DUF1801 domain-containing protein [Acidobacteriota bacterium]
MRSAATSVADYIRALPDDRRAAIETVRGVVNAHLPAGYEEAMNWGMITWQVPLATCPDTYSGQPLMYAALASQKRYMALHLMGIYTSPAARQAFEAAYRASGKRFDAGKACVRFRKLDDLPLDLVGETIASLPAGELVRLANAARRK